MTRWIATLIYVVFTCTFLFGCMEEESVSTRPASTSVKVNNKPKGQSETKAKTETKKNLGGKPGAVYAMVFKIGFCPAQKLDDGPVNQ